MNKGTVFFHPIEGTGTLTISWTSNPKGDAVDAKQGCGVGFFSDSGELLCVIFDEVQADDDQQSLVFELYRVDLFVKNGRVTYSVTDTSAISTPKKRAKRKPLKSSITKHRSRANNTQI